MIIKIRDDIKAERVNFLDNRIWIKKMSIGWNGKSNRTRENLIGNL
jgi:hypothetical protein